LYKTKQKSTGVVQVTNSRARQLMCVQIQTSHTNN